MVPVGSREFDGRRASLSRLTDRRGRQVGSFNFAGSQIVRPGLKVMR